MRARSNRSCREQLQEALGDLGEVLPRFSKGDGRAHLAAGWYADLHGEEIFLGDTVGIAFMTIGRLALKEAA